MGGCKDLSNRYLIVRKEGDVERNVEMGFSQELNANYEFRMRRRKLRISEWRIANSAVVNLLLTGEFVQFVDNCDKAWNVQLSS